MSKIGLFFGSFNPVHIGHLAIAGYMKEFTDIDQVWLVISPQNPLKKKGTLLADHHRLYLAELAIGDNDALKPSDIEFRRQGPSYTIDTMALLSEKYPRHRFVLIMGEDNLYTLHKWKNARELVKRYPILVYPRPGISRKENIQLDEILSMATIRRVNAPLMDISGSFIRNGIRRGKNMSYYLHPAVWQYIVYMHFYEK
ncbi:MAG TPA: nicotinate (nicotinamide) nucleotide adenylyltransferase [Bacteroidales bacterium]|nr:nicotinate-nucleotide adenylyltransferase [Bacteroidales bacterium]HNR42812.1 nicotinate (nicotinamide) nucleotide adenylyltransferase [Bacteroidales bacterium]HPM18063.1 nicotinate (nicotinamide) nucleotide adenylyltransferase [Bacteroidales bacterium]